MPKIVTHEVVRHMGNGPAGKPRWKQVGKVVKDTDTGREVLWLAPAALRTVMKGLEAEEGVPFLIFPKTKQALTPPPQPAQAANPPGGVTPVPQKYDEPPIDFDDDIPF